LIKAAGRLVQKDNLDHSYPFCWRSDTPLIYKAVPSWFVRVEDIRDKIVANNNKTYWVPNNVKEGRFHNWLKDARDWAVSRNRFWGTPIPIWASEDMTEVICIGSIDELAELSGVRVDDLHRETIDDITIPSKKNPGTVLKRIDEVFDCWFESGSMPYAQKHYPFENKEKFEKSFPANFIAEGLDQTRGWFYTLMVLATALFDKPAFQNLIVNGMVLASDGKKMSKRLKNYPDPVLVINKYGADGLRMYLINSPVVRAESLKFQESGVHGIVKEVFLPWYHAVRLLLQNLERRGAAGTKFVPSVEKVIATKNPTDVWISAATQGLIKFVHEEMGAYRLYTVMPALVCFVTQLTNWYVRLNRGRFKGMEGDDADAETGLQVLYNVLLDVTITMAPFTPFITEFFYQHLRKLQPSYSQAGNGGGSSNPVLPGKSDSVHYLTLPAYDSSRLNQDAVDAMEILQSVVELGRNVREKRLINLKTPVHNIVVILRNPSANAVKAFTGPLKKYILSELNAWNLTVVPKEEEHKWVKLSLAPDFSLLGKKLGKKINAAKNTITGMSHADAVACIEKGSLEVEGFTIDTKLEIISKLAFSKEGDNWESASSPDGGCVVAVDCTQDEAILSAGMSRELISHIQQLRKSANLEMQDVIESFFDEDADACDVVEKAIAMNVSLFRTKLKGSVPVPRRFAPKWSIVIGSGVVEIGGSKVKVMICRPAVAVKNNLDDKACTFLATVNPLTVETGATLECSIDGDAFSMKEGENFWCNTVSKLEATKALNWL